MECSEAAGRVGMGGKGKSGRRLWVIRLAEEKNH